MSRHSKFDSQAERIPQHTSAADKITTLQSQRGRKLVFQLTHRCPDGDISGVGCSERDCDCNVSCEVNRDSQIHRDSDCLQRKRQNTED